MKVMAYADIAKHVYQLSTGELKILAPAFLVSPLSGCDARIPPPMLSQAKGGLLPTSRLITWGGVHDQ
jgi:hypothetical protein